MIFVTGTKQKREYNWFISKNKEKNTMNIGKSAKREKMRFKKKHGMRTSGKSIFAIVSVLVKKKEKVQVP
jgi:phosphotransferase system HPr-like phosphotransfer protein